MFNTAQQLLLRQEREQREKKEKEISDWLLHGGGGFEGTPESVRFTFAGVVDLLAAYEEYLVERVETEADTMYTLMEVPGVVPTEVRRILRRVSGK